MSSLATFCKFARLLVCCNDIDDAICAVQFAAAAAALTALKLSLWNRFCRKRITGYDIAASGVAGRDTV